MAKSKKETLVLLSRTADAMAVQVFPISRAQVDWFVNGCVVALRKLGVSLEQVERTWHADEAMDKGE